MRSVVDQRPSLFALFTMPGFFADMISIFHGSPADLQYLADVLRPGKHARRSAIPHCAPGTVPPVEFRRMRSEGSSTEFKIKNQDDPDDWESYRVQRSLPREETIGHEETQE